MSPIDADARFGRPFFYQKKFEETRDELKNEKHIDDQRRYLSTQTRELMAKVWLIRAQKLADQGRLNEAIEALEMAQKEYPYVNIKSYKEKFKEEIEDRKPLDDLSPKQKKLFVKTINKAQNEMNAGKNEKALNTFASALSLAPRSVEALEGYLEATKRHKNLLYREKLNDLFLEARTLAKRNKLLPAISRYNSILEFDPANSLAIQEKNILTDKIKVQREKSQLLQLAKEYERSGQQYLSSNQFNEAEEQFSLGLNILPNYTNWRELIDKTHKAREAYDKKKFEVQLKDLEKYFQDGLVAIATEDFQKAVLSFQSAIKIAEKYNQKSTLMQAKELFQKATENLNRKEEENVSQQSPYFDLVTSLKGLGIQNYEAARYNNAKSYFTKILELFPKNKVANRYFILCNIKLHPKDKKEILDKLIQQIKILRKTSAYEARRLYDLVSSVDSNYVGLRNLSGVVQEKKVKLAAPTFDQRSRFRRAQTLASSKPEQSIILLQKVLAENPGYGRARTLLARLEARIVTPSPPKLNPIAQRAYAQGMIYYNSGRIREARNSFQKAIKAQPNFRKARVALNRSNAYLNN